MYLLQRLVGVMFYFLLLLMTIVLMNLLNKKYLERIVWLYLLILTYLAYKFVPPNGADLPRIISVMHSYASVSLSDFLKIIHEFNEPVSALYLRFISTFNNDRILPAATAFIVYFMVFKMMLKKQMETSYSKVNLSILLLFLMSSSMYMEVISGIRSMLAISLISYSLHLASRSSIKNPYIYILDLLALLIHKMAYLLIFIKTTFFIGYYIVKAEKVHSKIIITFFSGILILISFNYASERITQTLNIFLDYYTYGEYKYIWEYVLGFIQLFLIIYARKTLPKSIRSKKEVIFLTYLNIITLFSVVEYNTFHRLVYFNVIVSIPTIQLFLENGYKKSKRLFIIFSVLALIISLFRGNLSSYKFLS